MIICFSGTGNSRRIADDLQDILGDELVRFPPGLMRQPEKADLEVYDQRVIWVFPIFGWGLPTIVERALRGSKIHSKHQLVHHMVCTCGDDIGYADHLWRKIIEGRGWKAGSAFSVQMPNTYTFMKGFDVDPQDVIESKLKAAYDRCLDIGDYLSEDNEPKVDVVRGKWAWLKTYVLRRWFYYYKMSTKPFHTTDACCGCGICARNCPMGIIEMRDKRPAWIQDRCVMCSRCYHCCPKHAVAYGNATKGKGQYLCPDFSIKK